MKRFCAFLSVLAILSACQDNETLRQDFTGNESTYALLPGDTYPVSGIITFKEKNDGSTFVSIALTGTEGDVKHPVHLHLGSIDTPGADVTALLNPVTGNTGVSETTIKQLADETTITYQQLIGLDACIKVHLADSGPAKDIVLAGGNIGIAAADAPANGRAGTMSVCKSE
jgi:hypothetical protein